nr:thioesterase domain-containing protein [Streptomyces hygroscopicus]
MGSGRARPCWRTWKELSFARALAFFATGFYETLGIAVVTVGLGKPATWVGHAGHRDEPDRAGGRLLAPALVKRAGPGRTAAVGLGLCAVAAGFVAVPDGVVVIAEDETAAAISAEPLPLLDRGLVLFGHGMGAAPAFEVALLPEQRHGRGPDLVVVSGRGGPAPRSATCPRTTTSRSSSSPGTWTAPARPRSTTRSFARCRSRRCARTYA